MYDYSPEFTHVVVRAVASLYIYLIPNISDRVIACPIAELLLLLRIHVKDRIYVRVTFCFIFIECF